MGAEVMSETDQRNRTASSVSAAIPALVKQVKENSFSILSNNFSHFFSSCDDLFFDLASKAGTNNEQNLYFDAMREVRIKKPQVWNLFKDRFENNFRDLTKNRLGQSNATTNDDDFSLESISLVDKDDMEQDVAITSIVNRSRLENQELLYQLNCRFDYLMPDVRVNESNNPLDPAQICGAVNEGLSALELDVKCKVILLKHLDRTVVSELRNIYLLSNEFLINAGILPQIRFDVRKNNSATPPPAAFEGEENPFDQFEDTKDPGSVASTQPFNMNTPMGSSGVTLGQVMNMFSQLRQNGVAAPNFISRPAVGSSMAIPQKTLLDALTNLQLSSEYLQSPQEFSVRNVVERILDENKQSGKEDALHESDEDIINLVAMFFDFVLDDRNLPVPFQALISRLQIPILKVALKDKDFFTHSDHPARRLINEIASSAVGWDESSESTQDKLYKAVNKVVHFVIENFSGDIDIFEQAQAMFKTETTQETKKADVLEKRTQEAAQGKAKADHAREQSNEVLLARLKEAQLPENVLYFLTKEWQKVLLYIHLKHGEDSTEWLDARQVIEQIVWAIRPHHDERSIKRLERIKDEILDKVSNGLEAVSISRETILNTLSVIEQNFSLVLSDKLNPEDLISLKPEHLVALGQAVENNGKEWDQLTAVERQQLKLQAAAKEYVAKVQKLKPGTWVQYAPPNSAKSFRCKLALVTEPNKTYVFVNRFGLRVFEKRLDEVAIDMQKGYFAIMESGVLFDRAMGNITTKLKSLAG